MINPEQGFQCNLYSCAENPRLYVAHLVVWPAVYERCLFGETAGEHQSVGLEQVYASGICNQKKVREHLVVGIVATCTALVANVAYLARNHVCISQPRGCLQGCIATVCYSLACKIFFSLLRELLSSVSPLITSIALGQWVSLPVTLYISFLSSQKAFFCISGPYTPASDGMFSCIFTPISCNVL